MNDIRRPRRPTIPFMRSDLLQVGDREHIVTIVDLSPEGAFLAGRIEVRPGQTLCLSTALPRAGHQVSVPCERVWNGRSCDVTAQRPAEMAVLPRANALHLLLRHRL